MLQKEKRTLQYLNVSQLFTQEKLNKQEKRRIDEINRKFFDIIWQTVFFSVFAVAFLDLVILAHILRTFF